jgi:hypothetical protein
VLELMEAINQVRPRLWARRGRDGPITYLDVDGTIVPTTGSRKQGMDMSYNRIWGYAPLIVSLANTKEVLYLVNRSGNAPSHAGAADWIDRAIDLLAQHTERVCLRGDTDFSLTAHFDRWAKRCGADWTAAPVRSRRPAPTRARREDHKQRIVTERGYWACGSTTRTSSSSATSPASAPGPTGWSRPARTSAGPAVSRC